MPTRAQILEKAAALRAGFERAGAIPVETPVLQPAETLLDLYGEDIRARAYVTSDALRGEQMLRPDFTVPVVQMHMRDGAEPARYTYAGEVFRRQEEDEDRANEYIQVGYEIFDRSNVAAADAEVFALITSALNGLNLRAATGDIGVLMAAVGGLNTTDRRKTALMRHIWRPQRFRAVLDRVAGPRLRPGSRPCAKMRRPRRLPQRNWTRWKHCWAFVKPRRWRWAICAGSRPDCPRLNPHLTGWRHVSTRWPNAVSMSTSLISRPAMAGRRWNITTGLSLGFTLATAPICHRSQPAGVTMP